MTISSHPHPNPSVRRLVGWLAAVGLLGVVFGTIGLLLIGFGYGLPLTIVMIPFLWGLSAPLLLLTSLHPVIIVEEEGLRLKPLVFPASFVQWDAIVELKEHSLLKPPPTTKRGRRKKAAKGHMIVATRLPIHYRVVGLFAGVGFRPVFAISDHTHQDYLQLYREIKKSI